MNVYDAEGSSYLDDILQAMVAEMWMLKAMLWEVIPPAMRGIG